MFCMFHYVLTDLAIYGMDELITYLGIVWYVVIIHVLNICF